MSSYYEVRSPEYLQILPTKQMFGSGGCSNKGNVCRDEKVRSPEYLQILPTKQMFGSGGCSNKGNVCRDEKVRSLEYLPTLPTKNQQMGSVDAYGKNQSKFGDSFAHMTSYSSGLNQAAQAMAQIKQAGSPESLASLLAVSAAASVSGIQGSIRGAHGAGNYITLAGKQAEVQTGIGSKMMSSFGVGGLTTAGYASQAASTQGTLNSVKALGGVSNYVDTMAYAAEKKAVEAEKQAESDLAGGVAQITKGSTHVSAKGREAMAFNATQQTTMAEKSAMGREALTQKLREAHGTKDGFDIEKTAASYGMNAQRYKEMLDKGDMSYREIVSSPIEDRLEFRVSVR